VEKSLWKGLWTCRKAGCGLDKQLSQKGLASEEPHKAGGKAENLSRFVIKILLAECVLSVAVSSK
jgi:hypothetical protein